jgi:hypothetical protein
VAHRGLANADPGSRPRDASFHQQGIEMNKQIQIDTA